MTNKLNPLAYATQGSGSEDAHQIALFMWIQQEGLKVYPELRWLFHVPNGGQRSKATAARFKAMGVKAGVPDLCLPVQRQLFIGLWIELKKPKHKGKAQGKTNSEQDIWIAHLRKQGYAVAVCIGFEEARDCLIQYLELPSEEINSANVAKR